MKTRYFLLSIVILSVVACTPKREKLNQQIREVESNLTMLDVASNDVDAEQLIGLYVQYADAFPKDSLSPIYLMKAADIASNIDETDDAINYLDRIIEDYSDFDDIAMCYFLKGHAYELAEKYDDARTAYEAYLELFPDHFLAPDTRKILPILELTPEEQFQILMENASDTNLVERTDAYLVEKKK